MYHPEYQLLEFTTDKKWKIIESAVTDEIAYHFSKKLHETAKLNSNRLCTGNENHSATKKQFNIVNAVSRVPSSSYPMIDSIAVYAYGYK